MTKEKPVLIYTDGACSGNPGPGGWAALLLHDGKELELSGYEPLTTNNRMELMATIQALAALKRPMKVKLYTDSMYVKEGMTTWIKNWQRQNWLTSTKKPVKNADLWQELLGLSLKHEIEWHWVKGHAGHPENERVDVLARLEIKQALNLT